MNPFTAARNISLSGTINVWYRNWRVFRKMFWRAMVPTLFEPFLYLLGLGIGLGVYIPKISGIGYLQFIAPGLIASSVMFGASYECTFNSFIRMKYQKTYEAMLATPLTMEEVISGEILWGATRSSINATFFLLTMAVLGLIESAYVVLVFPMILIAGLLFGAIGMVYTAIIPEIGLFNYYFTLFITPLFLFSGIFYPVNVLPAWAQQVAWFTPLFHVVNVCRKLTLGSIDASLATSTIWLLVLLAALFLVPVALMKKRLLK